MNDYEKNVSGLSREIEGVFRPKSEDEIKLIVNESRINYKKLKVISTGKNWGFGSSLPHLDKSNILDLSDMNKILEFNDKFGYIVIEPGVTQRQVYELLKNTCWYLDVTGSSADSSILGNTLQRGIAYNSQRVEFVQNLTMIDGRGETVRSGFENTQLRHLYRHGYGPNLEGLFYQSAFGVVTQATIRLIPRPECMESFFVRIEPENLSKSVDIFQDLMAKNLVRCIPHIGNKARFALGVAPLVYKELKGSLGVDEVESLLEKLFTTEWSGIGSVSGTKRSIAETKKIMKKSFRGIAKVEFNSTRKISLILKVLKFLKRKKEVALIEATQCLRDISCGTPTYRTLYSLYWPRFDLPKQEPFNPDDHDVGFLYCTPFAPLSGDSAIKLFEIAESCRKKYDLDVGVTLNAVTSMSLEAVVSVSFDRRNKEEVQLAHACAHLLHQKYVEADFLLYRVGVGFSDYIKRTPLYSELKNIFDPDNIFDDFL